MSIGEDKSQIRDTAHPQGETGADDTAHVADVAQVTQVADARSTALRVQMELPVPEQDRDLVQRMLERQDWPALGRYLGWKHPRHRLLIGSWLQGGRSRGGDIRCSLDLLA